MGETCWTRRQRNSRDWPTKKRNFLCHICRNRVDRIVLKSNMAARMSTLLTKRLEGGLYTRFQQYVKEAPILLWENRKESQKANSSREARSQETGTEISGRENNRKEACSQGGYQEVVDQEALVKEND